MQSRWFQKVTCRLALQRKGSHHPGSGGPHPRWWVTMWAAQRALEVGVSAGELAVSLGEPCLPKPQHPLLRGVCKHDPLRVLCSLNENGYKILLWTGKFSINKSLIDLKPWSHRPLQKGATVCWPFGSETPCPHAWLGTVFWSLPESRLWHRAKATWRVLRHICCAGQNAVRRQKSVTARWEDRPGRGWALPSLLALTSLFFFFPLFLQSRSLNQSRKKTTGPK